MLSDSDSERSTPSVEPVSSPRPGSPPDDRAKPMAEDVNATPRSQSGADAHGTSGTGLLTAESGLDALQGHPAAGTGLFSGDWSVEALGGTYLWAVGPIEIQKDALW